MKSFYFLFMFFILSRQEFSYIRFRKFIHCTIDDNCYHGICLSCEFWIHLSMLLCSMIHELNWFSWWTEFCFAPFFTLKIWYCLCDWFLKYILLSIYSCNGSIFIGWDIRHWCLCEICFNIQKLDFEGPEFAVSTGIREVSSLCIICLSLGFQVPCLLEYQRTWQSHQFLG